MSGGEAIRSIDWLGFNLEHKNGLY